MNSIKIFRRGVISGPLVVVALFYLGFTLMAGASEPPRSEIEGAISGSSGWAHRVNVTAFLLQTPNGYPVFKAECQTLTDSAGNYKCSSIPSGHYILLAYPSPSSKKLSVPQGDKPSPTFYPGTTDIEDAELVRARPNTLNVFNFSLQQRPIYPISGSIEGKPSSVSLDLYRIDAVRAYKLISGEFVRYDPATGNFTVKGVSKGQYLLAGNCYFNPTSHESLPLETLKTGSVAIIVAGDNVSNAVLTPSPITTIHGELEVDGAIPGRSFRLELQNAEDGRLKYEITVSPNGTFRLSGVLPGNYRIANIGLVGAYVQFVKIGDFAPTAGQFLIPSNSNVHIEMSMTLHAKTISGAVSNWTPGIYRPHVLAKNKLTGDVRITETDQNGRFSMSNLTPGEYDLYAWTSLDGIAYQTSYGLKQYKNNKTTVSTDDVLSIEKVEVPLSSPPS
jgi:hypothetical protein